MSLILDGTNGVSDIDGSAATPAIRGTDTNTGIFFPAADTIAFAEGGAEVARFDSSGNFGVGVTAGAPATGELLVVANKAIRWMNASSGTEYGDIYTDTSNNMVFRNGSGATERMRIASNGYVYVNTTDTAAQDGHVSIKATVAGQQCIDSWNSATAGTRTHAKFRDSAGATVRGSITSDGANTAYVTSSDYRLKENIAPLANALSTIVQLKPSVWTWKENQEAGQGFIAHELAEVVPQAVTGEKDAVDADGKPQYQGVDTSFLVATLTAAIQELKAELDTTKARLAALENK
jgi:hypothetical protein